MSNDISNYNNWLDAWNDFYEKEKELVELDPNAALVSSVDAEGNPNARVILIKDCLLYTSPSPRDDISSRMPSSA